LRRTSWDGEESASLTMTLMPKKRRAGWVALWAVVLTTTTTATAGGGPAYALQASLADAGDAGASNAFFGYSVAIDSTTNTVVVGAPADNGTMGAAYVYVMNGSTWALQQQLTAPDPVVGDEFGYEVAVSGNTVMVDADEKGPNEQDGGARNGQGYVYVFARTGTTWTYQTEFTTPANGAAGDCFGCSIALRGNTAFIGANGRLGGTGEAYVYTGSGSSWTSPQQFLGISSDGGFGSAVAISSNGATAVVGAPGTSSSTGEAFVYALSGSTWSQQTTLTSGVTGDSFGFSVAVDGSTALIGAYTANSNQGAAYAFATSGGTPQALLQPANTTQFGWAVALSGTNALVGAYELASGPGAAYGFTESDGSWSPATALQVPAANQDFGYSVALSSSMAVVGAFGESNPGGAYVYTYTSGSTTPPAAAPAMGALGCACLSLLLLGAALWSMKCRRSLRGLIVLGLLVGTNACSAGADGESAGSQQTPSTNPTLSGGATGSEDTGSVGLQLTLPGGENINVVDWAITGPNGATTVVQSSSVTVQGLAARFVVGNIPAGTGYQVTLSGTSTDSTVTCTGSAQFSVMAHATTLVSVQMACGVVGTGGRGTNVNGMTFNCAAWSSVTANPSETKVGNAIALAATASGPDPSMLTYAWSSSTGSFSSPSSAASNFTCTQVGTAMVTLTVGDGPVPAGSTCNPNFDTDTIAVTCDPGPDGGAPMDGGPSSDAGPPPPPTTAAPATPPWGLAMLAAGILGIGTAFSRRASRRTEIE
jgi:hypothetical protein